jgi:hypothetical protein
MHDAFGIFSLKPLLQFSQIVFETQQEFVQDPLDEIDVPQATFNEFLNVARRSLSA